MLMRRRDFIRACGLGTCGLIGTGLAPQISLASDERFLKPAHYYEKLPNKQVRCLVCPRKCVVGEGQRGYCRVRENINGEYYTIVYGRVCARHVDPIEKKPFFHFLPGTTAYSIATVGCNMACKFCQNWQISQAKPEEVESMNLSPTSVLADAAFQKAMTVAYTYTEPIVFSEYVLDCAHRGHDVGLRSVMVSAGYINEEPLKDLTREMDAIKIDLKAYDEHFYADVCSTSLKPVLDTIVRVKGSGTWLEIVNLIIPTLNDGEKQIERLCNWVIENVGDEVPVHFTRFHPTYRLKNLPNTPISMVEKARKIAMERGIKYAYVGNVGSGHPGESTYCPSCGAVLIKRSGYSVKPVSLKDGKCSECGTSIPGVWS
jgi:pyruvate formate lyase activating enzyme